MSGSNYSHYSRCLHFIKTIYIRDPLNSKSSSAFKNMIQFIAQDYMQTFRSPHLSNGIWLERHSCIQLFNKQLLSALLCTSILQQTSCSVVNIMAPALKEHQV